MKNCNECGSAPTEEMPEWMQLPYGGLHFLPRAFGYYGGYWDNIPWTEPTDEEYVTLCKDCTERLIREFPSIFAPVKKFHEIREETSVFYEPRREG